MIFLAKYVVDSTPEEKVSGVKINQAASAA
jgi:hypothetical protein